MKYLIVLLLIIFEINNTFSQENIELLNFHQSEIDTSCDAMRLKTRIIKQSKNKDSLIIEIGTTSDCHSKCKGKIDDYNNNNLFLEIDCSGEYTLCKCGYIFKYIIKDEFNDSLKIFFKNERIQYSDNMYYEIKYEIYNNDTINYFDLYGLKQGLHIVGDKKNPKEYMFYKNDVPITGRIVLNYYENGNKKNEYEYINREKYIISYFENGELNQKTKHKK